MPNTKSAKKALRKSLRRWVINEKRRRKIKIAVRNYLRLIKEKKFDLAKEALSEVYKQIDKASKRFMHHNKASRLKSKYAKLLTKIQ